MNRIVKYALITAILFFVNPINHKALAQSNWEAGVRFGNDFSFEATIPLAKAPRLHTALYIDNHIATGVYFDWMFALEGGPTGFKFYPGIGPELYFWDGLELAVAGDFGGEYSFDFPLTIGLDWRPNFMITNGFDFNASNWGVFARYRFGKGIKVVKAN